MLTRERRADFRFIVLTRDKCKYKKKKKVWKWCGRHQPHPTTVGQDTGDGGQVRRRGR